MRITSARLAQLFFLGIFLYLFVLTDYRGKDEISVAVNSFFRADPLVVTTYVLAEKAFVSLLVPGLLLILFTIMLGRFFCGWMCPLGTVIDLTTGWIKKSVPIAALKSNMKYYLLFILLSLALFNVNSAGVLDPIAILIRALTFFLYPLFGDSVRQGWVGLYHLIGEKRDSVAFIYDFLRTNILPFRETFYPLAFVSMLLLAGILFLERYETRNWCRNLCPLGTLLGLLGRFSLFKRIPPRLCTDCGDCKQHCPTAFDLEILQKKDCILCQECVIKCRFKRARFRLTWQQSAEEPFLPERRVLITSFVSGFALSKTFSFVSPHNQERLLRPPGVTDEDDFMKKCVRCGECMKVCLRSALYPSFTETGIFGIFSPIVIPRRGYCEYNCTLCGQVCPSGAIPRLPVEEKKKALIGLAVFDKNHCLPYAKKINCIVCEEHCPIPHKAIRFEISEEKNAAGKTIFLKKPYVVDDLCNGCGICEYVCPLEGKSAIEVFARKGSKTFIQGGYGS